MNTQQFRDAVEFNRGFVSSIPIEDAEEVGDAVRDGRNCVFSAYGKLRSWRGVSLVNENGAPSLQLVGDQLAGIDSGNVLLAAGNSVWFVGSGNVFVDDFSSPIGQATSLLQFRYKGLTYQAALPAPPAPVARLATDSTGAPLPGQMSGRRAIGLTRRRSGVGTESPLSLVSNSIQLSNHRLSVEFPSALTGLGQDSWGVYATRDGFEGGTPLLLRVVQESEIAPVVAAALASVNSTNTSYSATSSASVRGRVSLIVLSPSGASPVTFREATSARSAGADTRLRFTRTQAAAIGDWLVAALTVKQAHTITPGNANKGSLAISSVTGAWLAGVTNGELVDIEVLNATQFRWKLRSLGTWTVVSLATAASAIGATGLHVTWSSANASVDEIGNTYTISPLSHIAPTGWTLRHVVSSATDDLALLTYTRQTDATDASTYDFTTDRATQMYGSLLAAANAGSVSEQAGIATSAGTTHTATLGAAPTANHLVVANFAAAGNVTFVPAVPLISRVGTVAGARTLELDFTDSNLLDVLAPVGVESPPAATHAFMVGQILVLAGTLDGTAINPSMPNQFEQYDLANTAFLNPTEPILRIDARPHEGSLYIWTRNSLQTPVFTGDDDFPILPRAIWPYTGIPNKNAACLSSRGAYAFTVNGPVRSNGTEVPDSVFAQPVLEYMRDWNPDMVVVTYDERDGGVALFCHEREILAFFETSGLWSTPLDVSDFYYSIRRTLSNGVMEQGSRVLRSASNLWRAENVGEYISVAGAGAAGSVLDTFIDEVVATGEVILRDAAETGVSAAHVSWGADVSQSRIVSACTKGGEAYLAIGDESFSQLYKFSVGVGTAWRARSAPRNGGAIGQKKTVRHAKLTADFDSTVRLHYGRRVNLIETGGQLVLTGGSTGYALADEFVSINQMHGAAVFWEWRLSSQGNKERGASLAKASALHPRTGSLALAAWGGGLAGWRISPAGLLEVAVGGVTLPDFGGAIENGDIVRLELTESGWVFYWLNSGYTSKAQASVAFATSLADVVNEPVGVKPYISVLGASLDVGRVGRGDGGVGCLNLYDGYTATEPVAAWEYQSSGLTEYEWERANYKCPVYGVEVCGVGADQSPARILIGGQVLPGHKEY